MPTRPTRGGRAHPAQDAEPTLQPFLMGEENRGKPLIESPVRIEADGTKALGILADAAARFLNEVVLPPAAALSGLAVDLVDSVRGPFRAFRVRNLEQLAGRVRQLREAQGISEPKALPPKASHVVLEQASFEDEEKLRDLWAQLIVNAQAGMRIDTYLFDILGKLSSDDVRLLQEANRRDGLEENALGTERLESLGLVRLSLTASMGGSKDVEVGDTTIEVPDEVDLYPDGYKLTPAGALLLDATTKPLRQILAEREEEARKAEERKRKTAAEREEETRKAEEWKRKTAAEQAEQVRKAEARKQKEAAEREEQVRRLEAERDEHARESARYLEEWKQRMARLKGDPST